MEAVDVGEGLSRDPDEQKRAGLVAQEGERGFLLRLVCERPLQLWPPSAVIAMHASSGQKL